MSNIDMILNKAESDSVNPVLREKYVDSVVVIMDSHRNDSIKRFFLRRCASDYYGLSKYDKSINVSNDILALAETTQDTVSIGKAHYFLGLNNYSLGNYEDALRYYQKAEKFYKAIKHPDLGSVMLYKAYILYNAGEYLLCESEASLALKMLRSQESNSIEVFQSLTIIASALNEQDNKEDAISYYQQSLQQVGKLSSTDYSAEEKENFRIGCYNNIGLVYEKSGNFKKAIEYYNKALTSKGIKKNTVIYSTLINNFAFSSYMVGKKEGVKELHFKALKIRDSLNNNSYRISSYIDIGRYYTMERDTAKAIKYLNKAYKSANKSGINAYKLLALQRLSTIDIEKSAKYSAEYLKLSDSLDKVSLNNHNKFARIEYETDQLKDEKDALVRKNSFIIGISVVVLLFVAAIFIIYYLNSRNKELVLLQEQQKANEEIYQLMFEQQQRVESARSEEKNRIAMELHDGILNNIYAVRLNLEFSNRKSDDETILKRKGYIKELQSLEAEIRSVSHDLSRSAKLVQGKDFADMLYFLVNTQKNNFNTHFELQLDSGIDWDAMPNTHKVNIYRIVQESLQNINKYSQAKNAYVDIRRNGEKIVVNVHDDGVGFDTKAAAGGIGLKNLRQRTQALNGVLRIDSTPGEGANINIQFAL